MRIDSLLAAAADCPSLPDVAAQAVIVVGRFEHAVDVVGGHLKPDKALAIRGDTLAARIIIPANVIVSKMARRNAFMPFAAG